MKYEDMKHENYSDRSPEEIESDIERTRAEVSSTLDAIQQKLTPGQLIDQAVSYARTSLPADFGANLGNAVRDNPLPVALVGIGLAWLMASGRHSDGLARQRRLAASREEMRAASYTSGAHLDEQHEGTAHRAASKIGEAGREVKDKVSDLGHRIGDRTSAAAGRAREMGQGARARLGEFSERSQRSYYRTKDSVSHMVEEQPLLIGALGLAVGTLLGAALPRTQREDEMMGEARDDLMTRAKDTLREQTATVKESVQRTLDERERETAGAQGARPDGGSSTTAPPMSPESNIDSTRYGGGQSPYGPH